MVLNLRIPEQNLATPRITVLGIGGGGCNSVNNMKEMTKNLNMPGFSCIAVNTDNQSLERSSADHLIQLGPNIAHGMGAGSLPEIGKAAAEETLDEVMEYIQDSHMVFITAGMGGGTGTGAAPIIASTAKDHGILTVGVVTKPFHFEGPHRMRVAQFGVEELQKCVDTLIVIPNQNLFRITNEKTTFAEAFKLADGVLSSGVRSIADLIIMPGLINLDFADIKSIMNEKGKAMMGTGEASGEGRAIKASESAISNPLLDNISMKGAKGILINITGGSDMTLFEVDEAANRIREEVDPNANIIFGSTFDDNMESNIRVSVVATGIEIQEEKENQTHTQKATKTEDEKEDDDESYLLGIQNSNTPIGLKTEKTKNLDKEEVFIPSEPITPQNYKKPEKEYKKKEEKDNFEIPAFLRRKKIDD